MICNFDSFSKKFIWSICSLLKIHVCHVSYVVLFKKFLKDCLFLQIDSHIKRLDEDLNNFAEDLKHGIY